MKVWRSVLTACCAKSAEPESWPCLVVLGFDASLIYQSADETYERAPSYLLGLPAANDELANPRDRFNYSPFPLSSSRCSRPIRSPPRNT